MNIEELSNRLKREGVEVFPVWDEDIARGRQPFRLGSSEPKSQSHKVTHPHFGPKPVDVYAINVSLNTTDDDF